MKATLEFNLPEDRREYIVASKSMDLYSTLWNYSQQMLLQLKCSNDDKEVYYIEEHLKLLHDLLDRYDISLNEVE